MVRAFSLLVGLFVLTSPARALRAAAAKVDITPDLKTERTYMAGFGAVGRKPRGVHDRLYARLLVMSDGRKTVAVAGFDLLGLYHDDVEDLRRLSGFDAPDRYLFAAATHDHSGPDTLGLWGPMLGVSGANLRYHARIKAAVADRLKSLLAELQEVQMTAAQGLLDPRGLCRDSRDPAVLDPYLGVFRLQTPRGKTISTVINWACHPEVLGPDNRLITADYPGPLCARIEEKTGGQCVFLSGPIGGLMTPDVKEDNFYESYRVGAAVADAALAALVAAPKRDAKPSLDVFTEKPLIAIENPRYLLFLRALSFGHAILDGEGKPLPRWKTYWLPLRHAVLGLRPQQQPWVRTEVSRIDLGPVRLLGLPAEAFPELVLGGYDGSLRFGRDLIAKGNPNPPDLSRAPKSPYLWEQIAAPVRFVVGLANDELGYLVPNYDFKTRGNLTMLPRLPGHYEETNSIGPSATAAIVEAAERLLREKPAPAGSR